MSEASFRGATDSSAHVFHGGPLTIIEADDAVEVFLGVFLQPSVANKVS